MGRQGRRNRERVQGRRRLIRRWEEVNPQPLARQLLAGSWTAGQLPGTATSRAEGAPEAPRRDLRCADLAGANLDGADLSGAALQGANLTRASLQRARLVNADLSDTLLRHADFTDADLRGANLSGAVIEQTSFAGATAEAAFISKETLVAQPELPADVRRPKSPSWLRDVLIQAFNELQAENFTLKQRIEAVERTATHKEQPIMDSR